ncbi:MAG: hypothetical protein JNL62_02365 [Bryobacterales bacterium]|nr:hypothetical protein [Bryobacterales bacterium]
MSLVVVGHGAASPFLHRQPWLGALQGLYLALLVHAQHKRLIRRIQIEADHIGEIVEELRIGVTA